MKGLLVALLLALTACASAPATPTAAPTDPVIAPDSWIRMAPGDARVFHGPTGRLVFLVVDETYSIDHTNASAVTWKQGSHYTTDYYVQDDDGTLWWYGRRGSWRAGRHGESPREVPIVDGSARFGDRVITVSEDGPVQLETPDGMYR